MAPRATRTRARAAVPRTVSIEDKKKVRMEPWIYNSLELIKHAEEHQQVNRDFDRHIALIGYDNAIEVHISTYLHLHPSQRAGTTYRREDVNEWLKNYHTLLNFFFDEFLLATKQTSPIEKNRLIHYHSLRNNLYHEGKSVVPTVRDIEGAHRATLFVFSSLFHINGEEHLKKIPLPGEWKRHFQTFIESRNRHLPNDLHWTEQPYRMKKYLELLFKSHCN